jgi:hypothetical protein
LSRKERFTLIVLGALTLVLRILATFRYRFDSDEPQHLHVAWGWTQGLVQYRDLFDNHAPLFHLLSAPLLALFGERENILLLMRAPMVPLFLIVVTGTWMIAKRWWSDRIAAWSVILLCTFAPFFLKSLEYRTDNLWNALWMIALVVLVIWRRPFIAGLILGLAICVSLKTVLLIIALGVAAIVTAIARDERIDFAQMMRISISIILGALIAPAILAGYYRSIGAWPNLVFCVVRFNEIVTQTHRNVLLPRLLYPLMLVFVVWRARDLAHTYDTPRTRFYLGVCAAIFTITIIGFWVLISPRDFLPMMPLFAITLTATIIRRAERASFAIFTTLAIVSLVATSYYAEWFRDRQREETTMLHQVLTLTHPGEPLMDYKGETIYRRRPYYFIFEKIGRGAMHRGFLRDTVADAMVREHCYVAQADGQFWPARARTFLNENFLDMGRLRAAGQWIRSDGTFSIAVEGDYVVVGKNGIVSGPTHFAAGPQRVITSHNERLAVLWAPAFARGFSPFHPKDRDF